MRLVMGWGMAEGGIEAQLCHCSARCAAFVLKCGKECPAGGPGRVGRVGVGDLRRGLRVLTGRRPIARGKPALRCRFVGATRIDNSRPRNVAFGRPLWRPRATLASM